ncbi:hypothetical protein G6F55_004612 [Rhizopus delemar]|nr:hypothetical protein G6F43_012165 [Rhizopus delemar]KAG1547143.1 hypothetical protein G6F51_004446 [Rhizopus arrhizus]KAG1459690.1 hypothetical protein G6F55_004612 [Rhizopus delemar]KAG1493393.1 hypothetical protein G6F54_008611 [Rhizopus delemar]KAG1513596.1 hypothetical protein G6F52_010124 [Rhizopus delemar]
MPIAMPLFGNKQLSIILAEPVVLLRGPPTEPTTHVLRGEVELVLSKPMTTSQVNLKLIGKSNMFWPEGLGPRGSKVYHEKTILEQNIILETEGTLLPGLNRWPFEFLIPNSLVETIEDEMAQVSYYVSATVQRPGMSVPNLRCRHNILLLRTLAPSADALTSHALPTTSIIAERRSEVCDATFYIEKSTVSSGTQFPISIVLSTQMKHVCLESLDIVLTERRVYQVPEYGARKAELHDFKLQLVSVTDMADREQLRQAMLPSSDLDLLQIKRAITGKNAHIPLGSTPFQYKFIFTLPNCLTMNHTTYSKEMNFLHHLKIDLELSTADSVQKKQIHLETPITILDCRLKEDFVTLPTYQEALSHTTVDEEDEEDLIKKRAGFFICPCYMEYKKKSVRFTKKGWDVLLHSSASSSDTSCPSSRNASQESLLLLPPPPPYQLEK